MPLIRAVPAIGFGTISALLAVSLAACAGAAPTGLGASAEVSDAASSAAAGALTGTWTGVHHCADIIDILTTAGFQDSIPDTIVGNGLLPGIDDPIDIVDLDHPCAGAIDVAHAHVFADDGTFASFDAADQPVDDGTYEVVDEDTVRIGEASFSYVIDGDELYLTPDMDADPALRPCDVDWQWATMVALPGQAWHRTTGVLTP
jgi:hypothetical protein